jgi:hypothetical protein
MVTGWSWPAVAGRPGKTVRFPALLLHSYLHRPRQPKASFTSVACAFRRSLRELMTVVRFLGRTFAIRVVVTGPLRSANQRNLSMTFITKALTEKLANRRAQRAAMDKGDDALDFKPVVKLFTPDAQYTWLLTELDPDGGLAFGLCDLGLGCPELGYVSLIEIASVRQARTSRRARSALRSR